MKSYRMEIAGVERELPLCKVVDDLYIASFVIFGDVEITKACAKALIERAPEHDVMISAEAKSIPLIYEMAAMRGGDRYIIARKYPKVYMRDIISTEVRSITTDKVQVLYLDGADAEYLKGKRVLIVDDVISTGESLSAVERLVEEAGGQIAGRMAILAEGDAQNREDLIYLEKLPLFDGQGNIKA